MSYPIPPFTPYPWQDGSSGGTPLTAADLIADENTLATYIQTVIGGLDGYLEGLLAPVNSPAFTGSPTAPTPLSSDNSTRVASTAFVQSLVGTAASLPYRTLESFGAVGGGTVDDTAAFQAAAQAGAIRISGAHNSYKITAPINLYTNSSQNAQGSYWDMNGITITTTSTTDAMFYDRPQDGTSFRKGITFAGGTYVGAGGTSSSIFRSFLTLNQWTDVNIIGGDYSLFATNAATFRGCGRVRVIRTTAHDMCTANGYNAWNFLDSINGNTVTNLGLEGQFLFTQNFVYSGSQGIPTAALALISTENNYANYDAVITDNTFLMNSRSCMYGELNSWPQTAGGNESVIKRVMVKNNIMVNTSTANNATCIAASDDGSNPFNDPLKEAQWRIAENLFVYGSNTNAGFGALQIGLSQASVSSNTIIASGTNGCCLRFLPDSATIMTDLTMHGNHFLQTNPAATSHVVDLWRVQNWSLTGGRIKSLATTAGQNVAGLNVDTSATQGFIGGGIVIDGALGNGITLVTMTNITIDGFKIRNPNATFNGATNNANGITLINPAAGTFNLIQNGSIIDDRGSSQMQYAICVATTPTTPPYLRNVIWFGANTSPFNGGAIAMLAEVTGCSGDDLSGFVATSVNVNSNPFSTAAVPYDQQVRITTLGGMTDWSYGRLGLAAPLGPPFVGAGVWVRRGEQLTLHGTTTGVIELIPMP